LDNVVIFIIIACFILIIALVNYFNLRLSSCFKQQRNVLVQKTFGASNSQLYKSTLIELLIINLLAISGALIIAEFLVDYFNILADKQFNIIDNWNFVLIILAILVIINLLVGILPDFISKKRIQSIGNRNTNALQPIFSKDKLVITKILIIIQFVAAILLISGAFIISSQVKLLMDKRLGAKSSNIVSITNQPIQVANNYQPFKVELLKNTLVENVTSGMETPGGQVLDRMAFESVGILESNKHKMPYIFPADYNYFTFFKIPIVAGNNFPFYNGNDSLKETYIINEAAAKLFGWKPNDAIGKPFKLVFLDNNNKNLFNGGQIVGVVKNFQISSSKDNVQPMVYFQKSCWLFNCLIQIDTARKAEALQYIRNTWAKFYPDYTCEIKFVDDLYKNLYSKEIQQQKLVTLFTLLAILISSMGLWSISSVISKKRTKEVGIRKVNGAKTIEIMYLLNKEFLSMVFIAIVIAVPLSYILLQQWIQNYACKIDLSLWMFVLAGLLAFAVALATISWQAWQTANRNPVDALKYE
jgi:putative ABC transport system permease protein